MSTEPDESHEPTWRSRALGFAREALLGIAILLVGLVVVGWLRAPDLPDEAPDFALRSLDGETIMLSELRGKTVVLNFWAEWCGPCRVEIPTFSRFARNHPDVVVLGVAVDGTIPRLKRVAPELGIDYPVVLADDATRAAYQVSTLPTTVIVRPDGSVGAVHSGIMLGPHLALVAR